MQNNKIRWGIISTGTIAGQFCADMSFVNNGELVAVGARNIENARSFADKYNITNAYEGYQSVYDDPNVDIVYVATPHNFHFENVRDALMAGKHVVCEKPITVSPEESKQLFELAKEKKLFLMEAMWTFFLPAIIQAKQWVEEGRIGKIKQIKADFGYPMPYQLESRVYREDLAGGCLLDMGIYPLAISTFFTEKTIENVYVKPQFAPNGVEDDLIILAESGDVHLTLGTSFQCKLHNWAVIIGEQGSIVIPDFWRASSCELYHSDNLVDSFQDNRTSQGLNYEAQAAGEAVLAKKLEHEQMPHAVSQELQEQLARVKSKYKKLAI
ncbi:Gfo/Idh/MocA family protein [Pseudocolwellia agarivorans]|uniref:Gfo/Idh/MocA family protein n=1 Tax=Pseudocolwellia agarivorans TaxID=1911682 RepID=UPI00098670D2|nr:Gfo/Idh/MocA family oxidoreductase [Pseudocolwellia agarivorans]